MRTFLPRTTTSAEETVALGRELAQQLQPGDILALYGDLGAGKTHLVKGICEGLGITPGTVTSPTFTLVNEYAGSLPVYHFDVYRIERIEELFELGYEDYFFSDGVTLVEWPEKIESLLPGYTLRIRLTHKSENERQIAFLGISGH